MKTKVPLLEGLHPLFPNPTTAAVAGAVFMLAASWCFDDAWEARGKLRPWLAKWLTV